MKKKIAALVLVIALAATAVIGGTLAYFTDTDEATNTFTVGNVKIELVEQQMNAAGELEAFNPSKPLMPGEENTIDKIVTVKNTGSEDAYMWIEVWVPTTLDNVALHYNYGDTVVQDITRLTTKTIEDVEYNGYVLYTNNDTAKAAGESTAALLNSVYMDAGVVQCTEDDNCLVLPGTEPTHYTGSWELIVNGVGFQAEGFDSITAALDAYYTQE